MLTSGNCSAQDDVSAQLALIAKGSTWNIFRIYFLVYPVITEHLNITHVLHLETS